MKGKRSGGLESGVGQTYFRADRPLSEPASGGFRSTAEVEVRILRARQPPFASCTIVPWAAASDGLRFTWPDWWLHGTAAGTELATHCARAGLQPPRHGAATPCISPHWPLARRYANERSSGAAGNERSTRYHESCLARTAEANMACRIVAAFVAERCRDSVLWRMGALPRTRGLGESRRHSVWPTGSRKSVV